MTIAQKIYSGFALLVALIIGQGVYSLLHFNDAGKLGTTVKEIRVPTALATGNMKEAVQRSLAALRGYMLIEDDNFKKQRAEAWKSIEVNLALAKEKLAQGKDQKSRAELAEIEAGFAEFLKVQDDIEALSHTLENQPTRKLFIEQLKPLAEMVGTEINKMIYYESKRHQGSSDPVEIKQSKDYLMNMAKLLYAFSQSMDAIRTYLITGETGQAEQYGKYLRQTTGPYASLGRAELESKQKESFAKIQESWPQIGQLAQDIFAVKVGDEKWDHAAAHLKDEAVPLGDALVANLDALANRQEELMVKDTDALSQSIGNGARTTSIALFAAILIGILVAAAITRNITHALSRIGDVVQKIAGGDLTRRVAVPAKRDEINEIAHQVNIMANNLLHTIRTVVLQSNSVSVCVDELGQVRKILGEDSTGSYEIIQRMAEENKQLDQELNEIKSAVHRASDNNDAVAQAAELLSMNIVTIAAASEEASANVTTVASAAEEMTANVAGVNRSLANVNSSVREVARSIDEINSSLTEVRNRCALASDESHQADGLARDATQVMEKLSESAREIGKVVEVIKNIASQTNMLALNAAIEAAGAGEAGKGFAVVANEVKDLARQTGEATNMIGQKIVEIQNNTRDAATAATRIAESVMRISQVNEEIAAAVEEQSGATASIATAMNEVTTSSAAVTRNAGELEHAIQDVSRAVAEAASGTQEIARSSSESATAAKAVSAKSADAKNYILSILAWTDKNKQDGSSDSVQTAFKLATYVKGTVEHFARITGVVEMSADSLRQAQAGLDTGQDLLDPRAIKHDYLSMLALLEQLVTGRMCVDDTALPAAGECAYGRWRQDGASDAYREDERIQAMDHLHHELHRNAEKVRALVGQGMLEAAQRSLEEFEGSRRHFFTYLDAFYVSADA